MILIVLIVSLLLFDVLPARSDELHCVWLQHAYAVAFRIEEGDIIAYARNWHHLKFFSIHTIALEVFGRNNSMDK